MKVTKFFYILAAAAMVSCTASKNSECADKTTCTESQDSAMVQRDAPKFDDVAGRWLASSLKGAALDSVSENVYIEFNLEAGNISAYAGCNQIGAIINRNGRSMNALAFDNSLMTQMLCPDAVREQDMVSVVNETRSFDFVDGNLQLMNENAEVIATFVRK